MSIWFRAFCTRPLTHITCEELWEALDDADFALMAERQELDEEAGYAAESSLTFEEEEVERNEEEWVVLLHYKHHEDGLRLVRMESWRGTNPGIASEREEV